MQIAMTDAMNTSPMGFSKDGETMYAMDATGRDKSALVSMPARKGGNATPTVIFEKALKPSLGMRSSFSARTGSLSLSL